MGLGCVKTFLRESQAVAQARARYRRVDGLEINDSAQGACIPDLADILRNHAESIAAIDL